MPTTRFGHLLAQKILSNLSSAIRATS